MDTKSVQYGVSIEAESKRRRSVDDINPILVGPDYSADGDDFFLECVELYVSQAQTMKMLIGCCDQYGLFQESSSWELTLNKGLNKLNLAEKNIAVPFGNGVFFDWSFEKKLYVSEGEKCRLSKKTQHFENELGYSGYPVRSENIFAPIAFSLIKRNKEETDKAQRDTEYVNAPTHLIRKAAVIGNSLTCGFGTFGMAAGDSDHDWFAYVKRYICSFCENAVVNRFSGSAWEGCVNSFDRDVIVEEWISKYLDGDEDLIIVQLSDNVNSDEKRTNLQEDTQRMLERLKQALPCAKIVFVAAWYNWSVNYELLRVACERTQTEIADIRDLSTKMANKNAVGNFYTKDNGERIEITNPGVASHPGDEGMKKIADRVISVLCGII